VGASQNQSSAPQSFKSREGGQYEGMDTSELKKMKLNSPSLTQQSLKQKIMNTDDQQEEIARLLDESKPSDPNLPYNPYEIDYPPQDPRLLDKSRES